MSRFTGIKVADEAFIPIMSLIIALCGAALVPPPLRPRPLDLTRIKGSGEKISQRGGAAAQASTRHRWHTARLEARSRSRSAGRGEQPTPTPPSSPTHTPPPPSSPLRPLTVHPNRGNLSSPQGNLLQMQPFPPSSSHASISSV